MGHTPTWAWIVLAAVVALILGTDLWGWRGGRVRSRRAALVWALVCIVVGLAFGAFVWVTFGSRLAQEYYAAYSMEEGLSLDNLLLFYVVFRSFRVPRALQHKVLFWGVLGASVFRGIFIFLGVAAIERWVWVSYLFSAVLLYAAWSAFRQDPARKDGSRVVEWLSRRLPLTSEAEGGEFIARDRNGRWAATPLLAALIVIELADVVFALDSVPAVLSVTRNRFVVYGSNVFAILGLRALYTLLAATITWLRYLHYGLAAVLAFAALKILGERWVDVPPLASIGIVAALVGGAVWASLKS